jgi:hypothetical protein
MNVNWFELEGINDLENAYKIFLNKFNEVYNSCFPLKKLKKRCGLRTMWLSQGILTYIKKKRKLYKKFLKNHTPQSETLYKTYRVN